MTDIEKLVEELHELTGDVRRLTRRVKVLEEGPEGAEDEAMVLSVDPLEAAFQDFYGRTGSRKKEGR